MLLTSVNFPALVASAAGRPVARLVSCSAAHPLKRRVSPGLPLAASSSTSASCLFSTTTAARQAPNQIFDPVRNPASLQTYLSLSASGNRPLITFWSASWCSTCRTVEPRVRDAVEAGVGQDEGGVNYVVVQFDSPDAGELISTYLPFVRSVPTLLAFDARRGEPVGETSVSDARKLGDREFLESWIRREAARHGGDSSGGGGGTGFGGLFGSWKK